MLAQYLLERRLGIHRTRIDGKTRAFCRKAAFGLGKTQLVPGKVHQVGAVFAVVDGEIDVEPDLFGINAQQACADAVKCAGPGQRVGESPRIAAEDVFADTLHAARHFRGGTPRKRHQQNTAGIGAIHDQMCDTVGQRVGLARTGPGDDQQRPGRVAVCQPNAMLHRLALLFVELFQIGNRHANNP
ncbi:hypothetical protein D3C72_1001200 [compost metagenome]